MNNILHRFSKKIKGSRSFTLIELIMIIVIIGILAIVVIPRYVNLQNQAREAAEQGVVGNIRAGIITYYANATQFPTALDSATTVACSTSNECFTNVLEYGITSDWAKTNATTYTGPTGTTYTYNASAGSFK